MCLKVHICVDIHQSVAVASKQFLVELSRHNYVTPTSYLELLGTFGKLIQLKKNEVSTQRNRTKTGLDKVSYNSSRCDGEKEQERGRERGDARGRLSK